MKKATAAATVVIIAALCFAAFHYWSLEKPATKPTSEQAEKKTATVSSQAATKDTIPSGWNTYNRLGFSFEYPSAWVKEDKDAEVVNLSGTIISIEINFADTLTKTTLLIAYHLAPKGVAIYSYALSQYYAGQGGYAKGGEQLLVAGNKALKASTTISKDGKGHSLNPPLRLVVVDFLDKKQTGEIQMQFNTPLPADKEVARFRHLLSTFRFTN